MDNTQRKHFCFILHSMVGGGMERVMVELANNFIDTKNIKITFILLRKTKRFYDVKQNVTVIEPTFLYNKKARFIYTIKTLIYTRKTVKKLNPDVILSFGEKWNSLNLIALLFTSFKVYVSDRSSPDLKLSGFHNFLRFILYRNTNGIVCQTHLSMLNIYKITKHRNIKVIGNPIRKISNKENYERENIILNVGRFISSKQQINLIEIFASIKHEGWRLVFIGEGQYLQEAREKVLELDLADKVTFVGESNNVDEYLNRSKIFAFTSILEGFPNALGEALETPLSCISFNCIAGPSDLIINNYNGFLINNNDFDEYKRKLQILMDNDKLREYFERNSIAKMKEFDINLISDKYYNFLINENTAN